MASLTFFHASISNHQLKIQTWKGVKLNEEVLRGASLGDILCLLLSSSRMNNHYLPRTLGGEGVCGPSPAYDFQGLGKECGFENWASILRRIYIKHRNKPCPGNEYTQYYRWRQRLRPDTDCPTFRGMSKVEWYWLEENRLTQSENGTLYIKYEFIYDFTATPLAHHQ